MGIKAEPHPAVPTPQALPLHFAPLSRAVQSDALQSAFAERARASLAAIAALSLPLVVPYVTHGNWRRISLFGIGTFLVLALPFTKDRGPRFRRYCHLLCTAVFLLLALGTAWAVPATAQMFQQTLLSALLVAGALFLSTFWFATAAGVCASGYILLLVRFGPAFPPGASLELLAVVCCALLVHRAQVRIRSEFNELALNDEARHATYLRAVEEAHKARVRFEKLSEAGKEGLIFHAKGKVLDANKAALDLLGYAVADLVGKPLVEVMGEAGTQLGAKLSDPKNSPFVRLTVPRKDGTDIEVLAFNHLVMLPEESVAVLGLRPTPRKAGLEILPALGTNLPLLN